MFREKLMNLLDERKEEMVEIRRHFHENPELSFKEEKTAQYIIDFYQGKEVKIQTEVGGVHGIIVTIEGGQPGKTIGLRADFDALPIQEETGLPFASKNPGVMHACGHDGHTAYLMILADCLIRLKEELPGKIKIIHQPAEETPPGGAKSIVESGELDDVSEIFGIHFFPMGKAGEIGYHKDFSMAGRTYFKLGVQGQGGHGSSPHMANDAIVAASYFVTAVQTVISRRLNPFEMGVVTIGSFDGKGSFNVIKDYVELEGDVRYMTKDTQDKIAFEVKRLAEGLEKMYGVTVTLTYTADYPPLYNDPAVTDLVVDSLQSGIGEYSTAINETDMLSGSEDFAYYLEKIPGTFFYIGSAPKGDGPVYFNHNPKFDLDEDALLVAAKAVGDVVCGYFKLN